jgi:DNA processing protein
MKINRVSPLNHKYLQIVSTIAKPPQKLHFIGRIPDTRIPSVAIVGTRKPTAYGKEVTYQLAYDLARKGIVIISGLALGVDGIAHRAALEAGGTTLAILPSSVDSVYPRTHHELAKRIVSSGGALLSEYDPPTQAYKSHFLERNRIVSGLADAVIVTEAATRSGTLATVAFALEQGREVFVVPGNITSPLSAGCNRLIKQGAHPITCVEDVLEIIAPQLLEPQASLALGSNSIETKLITLLQSGIRDGDQLQQESDTSASEFSIALTMMEMNGIIRSLGGNQWTLR